MHVGKAECMHAVETSGGTLGTSMLTPTFMHSGTNCQIQVFTYHY